MTVGVVDTRYGVSQLGADAERYRCACLHCTQGLAGRGDAYQCGLDWGLVNKYSNSQYMSLKSSRVIKFRSSVTVLKVQSVVVSSVVESVLVVDGVG